MKFSIIIPAYNAADRLSKCLDSIVCQSYKDYELIVVCDACTDNTAEIARSYGAVVEEVNYHHDGHTRNRGLELAQGEWILFLDDDDWWLHEYVLEQIATQLRAEKEVDVMCFGFIAKGVGYMHPLGNRGGPWIACWCKVYRHSFIKEARFSDHPTASDIEFTKQVFAKGPNVVIWDMPIYYYNYLRPGSISEGLKQERSGKKRGRKKKQQ